MHNIYIVLMCPTYAAEVSELCYEVSCSAWSEVHRAGGGKIELVRPLTIMLKLLLYTCQ